MIKALSWKDNKVLDEFQRQYTRTRRPVAPSTVAAALGKASGRRYTTASLAANIERLHANGMLKAVLLKRPLGGHHYIPVVGV